jgi:DNA-binding transcriptional LysR family regulator
MVFNSPPSADNLAQLEQSFGTKLFHRRPFGLTSAGTRLFGQVESFFAGLADLPARVRAEGAHRLRLAAPARILRDYLPEILRSYRRRFPGFQLTLFDANQKSAEELLRRREINFAITELEGRPGPSIESRILVRLPLILLVTQGSQFKTIGDIFYRRLASEPLISLPPDEVITKQFQIGLRRSGWTWTSAIELSSLDLVETYVALNFGVGVSVALPRQKLPRNLRALPLKKFPLVNVAALWMGDLPEIAHAFLADIRAMAARFER